MPPRLKRILMNRKGSLLIDALLATSIFGVLILAFSSGIMQGQLGTVEGSNRIRALYLAEEGLEAVKWVRDKVDGAGDNIGYDELFGSSPGYALDTAHGIKLVSNDWEMQDSTPTTIDGFFTRSIRFTDYFGDSNKRLVESIVSWEGMKGWNNIVLTSTLSNWQVDPPPPAPEWGVPYVKTSASDFMGQYNDVVIDGDKVYVADSGMADVQIYDISDLENPLPAPIGMGLFVSTFNLALQGDYLYVGTNDINGELKIVYDPGGGSQAITSVNLAGTVQVNTVDIVDNRLFVTRSQDGTGPELYVFDISSDPSLSTVSNPPILADVAVLAIYDTDTGTDMLASTGVSDGGTYYAYNAAKPNEDFHELAVVRVSDSVLTGGADLAINIQGSAILIDTNNDIAYIGAKGADACEYFALDISINKDNPNISATCGSHGADPGENNDASSEVKDLHYFKSPYAEHTQELLFGYMDGWDAINQKRFLQIIDKDNFGTAFEYNGNILDGRGCAFGESPCEGGVDYRVSDHSLVIAVGGLAFTSGSDIVVLKPSNY